MGGISLAAVLLAAGGMSVSITPIRSSAGGTGGVAGCPPLTANVVGAPGAITYLWEAIGGDDLTIASPAAATTGFTFVGVPGPGQRYNATVQVTVTSGGVSVSAQASVAYQDRRTA